MTHPYCMSRDRFAVFAKRYPEAVREKAIHLQSCLVHCRSNEERACRAHQAEGCRIWGRAADDLERRLDGLLISNSRDVVFQPPGSATNVLPFRRSAA